MNELKIFSAAEFGQIRTTEINGQPYFMASDVAGALGYAKPNNAIAAHCKSALKRGIATKQGNMTEAVFIPESDVYRLVIKSKLPGAERFEAWIMEEVLPSIRKTGGYIAGQETMSDSELIAKALIVAQRQIEERNKQIAQMQPKALFADAVAASHSSILIGDLAKLICQNGVEIGQKRLFAWMRDNGYLIKAGESRNMPMQRYVEQGLFEIKESNVCNPDGSIRITKTTKVTGKGQVYFVNKFVNC
ncbi:MAG: phage antirepressor KilAC domain-containing protein [Solibacillus sp.]